MFVLRNRTYLIFDPYSLNKSLLRHSICAIHRLRVILSMSAPPSCTLLLPFMGVSLSRSLTYTFRRIMTYLLPLRLLRGHLPSNELLDRFPELKNLCNPLLQAIKRGDLKAFDIALSEPYTEKKLLDLGLHLIFEKARELCLRGLFRRT